jgi:hypothetical protein
LLPLTAGAFGNRTLSDLSGFFSDDSALIAAKNLLRSLKVRLPNALGVSTERNLLWRVNMTN